MSQIPFGVSHRHGFDALTCALAEQRALELFDGELGDGEVTELYAHLHNCSPCRARYSRTKRFLAALRRQRRCVPKAPSHLLARVRALLAGAGTGGSGAPRADAREPSTLHG